MKIVEAADLSFNNATVLSTFDGAGSKGQGRSKKPWPRLRDAPFSRILAPLLNAKVLAIINSAKFADFLLAKQHDVTAYNALFSRIRCSSKMD